MEIGTEVLEGAEALKKLKELTEMLERQAARENGEDGHFLDCECFACRSIKVIEGMASEVTTGSVMENAERFQKNFSKISKDRDRVKDMKRKLENELYSDKTRLSNLLREFWSDVQIYKIVLDAEAKLKDGDEHATE